MNELHQKLHLSPLRSRSILRLSNNPRSAPNYLITQRSKIVQPPVLSLPSLNTSHRFQAHLDSKEPTNVKRPTIPFDLAKLSKHKRMSSDHNSPGRYLVSTITKIPKPTEIEQLNSICKILIEEQNELKKQINYQKEEIDLLKNEKIIEKLESVKPYNGRSGLHIKTGR